MKHIGDFDNIDDFGMTISKKNYKYVDKEACEDRFPEHLKRDIHYNYDDYEGMSENHYHSLETLLSGGSYTITSSKDNLQAEIQIDTSIHENLAKFGSVYSIVSNAINNIRNNYPNGFAINEEHTELVSNVLTFTGRNIDWYGADPDLTLDLTKFRLFTLNEDDIIISEQEIESFTLVDNVYTLTSKTLEEEYKHEAISNYVNTLNQYEKDLIQPYAYRENVWPKDETELNLLFEGTEYDDFVSEELNLGLSADTNSTNILWDRLYPHGQKMLDNEDQIMQKLILTFAMTFDMIYKYQEQLKYSHTITYDDYDCIPRNLVHLLANHFGWSLSCNLDKEDYSEYMLGKYNHYLSNYTSRKMSGQDINYEMWKRILVNVAYIYKKKGTKGAIEYFCNLYSIPEQLLVIEELINLTTNRGEKELIHSESGNISYTKDDGKYYYVDSNGIEYELHGGEIQNTKYLNINISPSNAIKFDFYDWGWENHPDIIDVNGNSVSISSTTKPSIREFYEQYYGALIGGMSKYDYRYSLLEEQRKTYYNQSVNKYTYEKLQPYVDFLDKNWAIIIKELIPASSKLMSSGVVYSNKLWNREKYKWQFSNLDSRELPFNEETTFTFKPEALVQTSHKIESDLVNESAQYISNVNSSVEIFGSLDQFKVISSVLINTELLNNNVSVRQTNDVNINTANLDMEIIHSINGDDDIVPILSGDFYSIDSPMLQYMPYIGETIYYGSSSLTQFSQNMVVTTNDTTIAMPFSAKNISDSGFTEITFELFSKQEEDFIVIDEDIEYSIFEILSETKSTVGHYKISSLSGLKNGIFIKVKSEYGNLLNNIVKIVYVNTFSNEIKTVPDIGFYNTPLTTHGSLTWSEYIHSDFFNFIRSMKINHGYTYDQILEILYHSVNGTNLPKNRYTDLTLIEQVTNQSQETLEASIFVIQYLKTVQHITLNNNPSKIINSMLNNNIGSTFNKAIVLFDWSNPDQIKIYNNDSGSSNYDVNDYFSLPQYNLSERSNINSATTSGYTFIGGTNELNSYIFKDKSEYFINSYVKTSVPVDFECDSFVEEYDGASLLLSQDTFNSYNNIDYRGRYFVYIHTPKEPNIVSSPENISEDETPASSITITTTPSIILQWQGVGDSDRMEIRFVPVEYEDDTLLYLDSYSGLNFFTGDNLTIINIPSVSSRDIHLYTSQISLIPDTYYWWRIINYRSKHSMFGFNINTYTATEPRIFKTGEFQEVGVSEGEIESEATPPGDENRDFPVEFG